MYVTTDAETHCMECAADSWSVTLVAKKTYKLWSNCARCLAHSQTIRPTPSFCTSTRQTHSQRRRGSPASSFIMKWRPVFIIRRTPAVTGLRARQSKKQLGIYKFLLKWWRQFALPFCSHIDKWQLQTASVWGTQYGVDDEWRSVVLLGHQGC